MKLFFIASAALLAIPADAFSPSRPLAKMRSTARLQSSADKDSPFEMPNFDMKDVSLPDFSSSLSSLGDYNFGTVLENASSQDELGSRGEEYFAGQAALILCILIGGVPFVGDALRSILGPGLLLFGIAIAVLSLADLGSDSLSPFPKPTKTATLKTSGIYAEMRHPMYSGLITLLLGLSLWTNSADRLLLTALLWYFIDIKSSKEEEFLTEKFPNEFDSYKVRIVLNCFDSNLTTRLTFWHSWSRRQSPTSSFPSRS